jgi:protein phosphatase-4 regulatory subunit 3
VRSVSRAGAGTMALAAPPASERKRVKVYELKNNDWYDRGTGFCSGRLLTGPGINPDNPEAHIVVVSEDEPERALLETRITKDDGYQKQQETLIVWTEANGVDMALSFQEAEGCSSIWEFVSEVQTRLAALAPDDGLSDEMLDPLHNAVALPDPQLGKLDEIEAMIRNASQTPTGRDALISFIMNSEQQYILKLAPLVEMAEDLESTPDLHRLCTIMKSLILLNDTSIIEFAVTDQAVMGVVGALEYDPDFPSHRANHRQYLADTSKFKQVVKIDNDDIRRKIHYTYRLQYLKDVVLARILDDPTFSVLNSLIFFHQVDIVNYLHQNEQFLRELFNIFGPDETDAPRMREAVLFIQNCCSVAKSIQANSRAHLYNNFIQFGLFPVVMFALRHHDAAVRVAGTDILVSLIDHDPHMVRLQIFNAIKEKTTPLTDTLIELLLVEVDLGVKSQMADAIKILLDPSTTQAQMDMMNRAQNGEFVQKQRGSGPHTTIAPQTDAFISNFYEDSAKRLFQPLKDLEHRPSMSGLTVHETSLYTHLVEVLCFFVRQHTYKSKLFILAENLHARVAQLLACPQKYMKLMALKWFRICIGLQDEFHNRQFIQHGLFEPILNIVYETMPRDNLLNSACLELFEYIKRENIKQLIVHLVEHHRERLLGITYVNTFQNLLIKYEALQMPPQASGEDSFTTQEGTPQRTINGQRHSGLREADADEEAYFNGDDDMDGEDDDDSSLPTTAKVNLPNGASPLRPLVSYPDDEEDTMDLLASSPDPHKDKKNTSSSEPTSTDAAPESTEIDSPQEKSRGRDRNPVPVEGSPGAQQSPPESVAIKRRREEDDEDNELGKLMSGASGVKRRNSSATSVSNRLGDASLGDRPNGGAHNADAASSPTGGGGAQMLRRKGSLKTKNQGNVSRFAFNKSVPIKTTEPDTAKDESPADAEEVKDG